MAGLRDPLAGPPARRGRPPKASDLVGRVESDGTPAGTHVYLPDGTELTQVQAITWELDADGAGSLTVRVGLSSIHATGRLDVQAGPTPDPRRA